MTKKGELKEKLTASIGNSWLETAYQTKDAINSVSDAQKAAKDAKKDPQAGTEKRGRSIGASAKPRL